MGKSFYLLLLTCCRPLREARAHAGVRGREEALRIFHPRQWSSAFQIVPRLSKVRVPHQKLKQMMTDECKKLLRYRLACEPPCPSYTPIIVRESWPESSRCRCTKLSSSMNGQEPESRALPVARLASAA